MDSMNWASAKPRWRLRRDQIGADQSGHAQGAVSARNAQEPGMRAGRLVQRPLIQDEGRLVQQRQARRHGNEL